jgi:hypothetical protein
MLPGTWLDINATERQSTYYVTIAARDIDHGLKVLENANAFAANRGGQVDNSLFQLAEHLFQLAKHLGELVERLFQLAERLLQ